MKISYEKAIEELQTILHDLKEGQVSMDELTQKVQRAKALLDHCKNKLRTTEKNISDLIGE